MANRIPSIIGLCRRIIITASPILYFDQIYRRVRHEQILACDLLPSKFPRTQHRNRLLGDCLGVAFGAILRGGKIAQGYTGAVIEQPALAAGILSKVIFDIHKIPITGGKACLLNGTIYLISALFDILP
jgi:hypothetical protein